MTKLCAFSWSWGKVVYYDTWQVISSTDECSFRIRVVNLGGEDNSPLGFGLVDDRPSGFRNLPVGHQQLKGSIGALCSPTGGAMMHDSDSV